MLYWTTTLDDVVGSSEDARPLCKEWDQINESKLKMGKDGDELEPGEFKSATSPRRNLQAFRAYEFGFRSVACTPCLHRYRSSQPWIFEDHMERFHPDAFKCGACLGTPAAFPSLNDLNRHKMMCSGRGGSG